MTRRSTVRPASSEPAIARPSSGSAGVRTTSHSSRTPRATASIGSRASARSSQATIEPAAWASATSRRASVVRPLERSPRSDRPSPRGRPPGPRIASRSAKPVEKIRDESGFGESATSSASANPPSEDRGDAPASHRSEDAPTTSPTRAGAAAPHFDRRVVKAAVTSGESAVIPRLSNRCSNESRAQPARFGSGSGPTARLPPAGDVAQWESTAFASQGSGVRIPSSPPFFCGSVGQVVSPRVCKTLVFDCGSSILPRPTSFLR